MDDETGDETSLQRQSSSISHHVQQYHYTDEATKAYHFQPINPPGIMLMSGQRRPWPHR
jgi:hypothetical protein